MERRGAEAFQTLPFSFSDASAEKLPKFKEKDKDPTIQCETVKVTLTYGIEDVIVALFGKYILLLRGSVWKSSGLFIATGEWGELDELNLPLGISSE